MCGIERQLDVTFGLPWGRLVHRRDDVGAHILADAEQTWKVDIVGAFVPGILCILLLLGARLQPLCQGLGDSGDGDMANEIVRERNGDVERIDGADSSEDERAFD